jgi:hypothetical protein
MPDGRVRAVRALQRFAAVIAVGSAVAGGSGCSAWNRVAAGSSDYELYRQTRLAATLEERLSASHDYLSEHPQGRWRREVERWYHQAEPRYFEAARDSVERLESYLALLPSGPHAKAAEQRIAELELSEKYERERETRILTRAHDLRDRLERAVEQRREFLEAVRSRVETVSAFEAFGKDVTHVPALLVADATCDVTRCVRTETYSFMSPEERELRAREAKLETRIYLKANGVAAIELRGAALFSRVGEAVQVRPVSDDDLQARVEAIGIAVQLVQNAVEPAFPEASCRKDAVSPAVLVRRCGARTLSMQAGFEADAVDRVVVELAEAKELSGTLR